MDGVGGWGGVFSLSSFEGFSSEVTVPLDLNFLFIGVCGGWWDLT